MRPSRRDKRRNGISKLLHKILHCLMTVFEIAIIIKCIIVLFQ